MQEIFIKDEYIKLQQALQLANVCSSGAESKYAILEGKIRVNGEVETRRGRKMRAGDEFETGGETYRIMVQ